MRIAARTYSPHNVSQLLTVKCAKTPKLRPSAKEWLLVPRRTVKSGALGRKRHFAAGPNVILVAENIISWLCPFNVIKNLGKTLFSSENKVQMSWLNNYQPVIAGGWV